ncbi:MAG: aminoglycoside phosphotransferase family protein [Bacteroidales bacterium]|nr:aminoglycoside phosphotransferase family protein [Bacteroidales bacterium]
MEMDMNRIVENFKIDGAIKSIKPLGEGFINDTYLVTTEGASPDYILQRKNKSIFPDVPSMMDNIARVTAHIRERVRAQGGDPDREAMTVVPTTEGQLCYKDGEGEYWAVTVFIDNTIAYDKADTPEIAFKGGQGIGRFQSMLSDFNKPLTETIKGFHNIRYRFGQWDRAVTDNPVSRCQNLGQEISWIETRREEMIDFWKLVERGEIPARVTHNDTKINNILFDKNGDVLCVIDLDTVMTSTSLNDFGDAIRSYANTGLEDDKNTENVTISMEMFEAFADGYLSERASQLTPIELKWLAFSALYITYEQVLRFLMDYIQGDTYYKIKYSDHNLVRTHAQMALYEDMERKLPQMNQIIQELTKKYL